MQLDTNEIHIYAAPLDVTIPDEWQATLSADENERAERLISPLDQKRFIAARAILRQLLAHYLDADPATITFTYGQQRKPALANEFASRLEFNLSHSENMAAYAFTLGGAIGIDIEHIRPHNKNDLAERFFSADEIAALKALDPEKQPLGFYTLWARKEAIIKANGKGLAQPLSSFSVSLDALPQQLNIDQQHWHLYPLSLHPQFAAAVATAQNVHKISIWDFVEQNRRFRTNIGHLA